jgi:hypothetical protein
MKDRDCFLKDGSKIAKVGGGPAGIFFAYLAIKKSSEKGIKDHKKIF